MNCRPADERALERVLRLPDSVEGVSVDAATLQVRQRIIKGIEGLFGDDEIIALVPRPVGRVDADRDLDLKKLHPAVEWAEPEPTAVRVASLSDLRNNGFPSIFIWFCTSVRTSGFSHGERPLLPQLAHCEVSLRQAETVPEPKHPMLPFLVDLERQFDAGVERDYDPTELVRYAIGASDYWADLALGWLDQGVPAQPLVIELEQLEADKSRPQNLRHRARRLRKSTGQTP